MKRAVTIGVVLVVGAVAVQLPSLSNDIHTRGGGGGGTEDLSAHDRKRLDVVDTHDESDADDADRKHGANHDKDDTSNYHPNAILLGAVQLATTAAFFWYKGEEEEDHDIDEVTTLEPTPDDTPLVVSVSQFASQHEPDGIRNRGDTLAGGITCKCDHERRKGWRWQGGFKAPLVIVAVFGVTVLLRPEGMSDPKPNAWKVLYFAWVTDLATGLGAVPFLCVNKVSKLHLGRANAVAAGMMSSASVQLFLEALESEWVGGGGLWASPLSRCLAGVGLGFVFIVQAKTFLDKHDEVQFADLSLLDAKKVLLIIMVMTLHSFTEGVGIGVSFGGERGSTVGFCISVCLTIHNIPEGLAVALVLIPRGISKLNTFLWCILTSLPQPLMAVPAFLFVETFLPLLPVGLGFASGAMLWVAYFELLEEAASDTSRRQAALVSTAAFICAYMLQQVMTGG